MSGNKKKTILSLLSVILIVSIFLTGCSVSSTPVAESTENNKDDIVTNEPEIKDEEAIINERIVYFYEYYPDGKYISTVDQVKDYMDALFVLDIRPSEQYNQAHLPGAINIPIKQIGNRLEEIPQNKPVLVVCNTGQSAAQTAGILNIAGIKATSLSGGFKAWEQAGLPIEN